MVDQRYFTKEQALKGFNRFGRFCWRMGACSLYLDYQAWRMHFWWWHPLTWLVVVLAVLVHGLANWGDIEHDLFVPRGSRKYPYRLAPPK